MSLLFNLFILQLTSRVLDTVFQFHLSFGVHCPCFFFFFFNKFHLFIYFWLCWVFVAACGLSLVVASGGYSLLQCAGFLLRWLLLLRSTGSRCAGFSSCGAWAQLLRGMWDLPGPGLEPVSPAFTALVLRCCCLQFTWWRRKQEVVVRMGRESWAQRKNRRYKTDGQIAVLSNSPNLMAFLHSLPNNVTAPFGVLFEGDPLPLGLTADSLVTWAQLLTFRLCSCALLPPPACSLT